MKSSDEMIRDLYERRDRYRALKREKRRLALKIGLPAVCFALVLLAGLGWQTGVLQPKPSGGSSGQETRYETDLNSSTDRSTMSYDRNASGESGETGSMSWGSPLDPPSVDPGGEDLQGSETDETPETAPPAEVQTEEPAADGEEDIWAKSLIKPPEGVSFKRFEGSGFGQDYYFHFDGSLLPGLDWCKTTEKTVNYAPIMDASYSSFTEKFVLEDDLIVIGKPKNDRECHLLYGTMEIGFTLTDFDVEEVLYGTLPDEPIRIRENYIYALYITEGECLIRCGTVKSALFDGCRYLLFLRKNGGPDTYTIYGGYGGLPLPDDYKNYNQDYLNHLAGYLNMDPAYCGKALAEEIRGMNGNYFSYHHLVDHSERGAAETLIANADDLIVALAQKYRIKIWPLRSKGYEDAGLPPGFPLAEKGCEPDLIPLNP